MTGLLLDEKILEWLKHSVTTRDANKNLVPNRQEDLELLERWITPMPLWAKVVLIEGETKININDFKKVEHRNDGAKFTTHGDIGLAGELDFAISLFDWKDQLVQDKRHTFYHEVGHRLHKQIETPEKRQRVQEAAERQFESDKDLDGTKNISDVINRSIANHMKDYDKENWAAEYIAETFYLYLESVFYKNAESIGNSDLTTNFPIVWSVIEEEFVKPLKEFADIDKFRTQNKEHKDILLQLRTHIARGEEGKYRLEKLADEEVKRLKPIYFNEFAKYFRLESEIKGYSMTEEEWGKLLESAFRNFVDHNLIKVDPKFVKTIVHDISFLKKSCRELPEIKQRFEAATQQFIDYAKSIGVSDKSINHMRRTLDFKIVRDWDKVIEDLKLAPDYFAAQKDRAELIGYEFSEFLDDNAEMAAIYSSDGEMKLQIKKLKDECSTRLQNKRKFEGAVTKAKELITSYGGDPDRIRSWVESFFKVDLKNQNRTDKAVSELKQFPRYFQLMKENCILKERIFDAGDAAVEAIQMMKFGRLEFVISELESENQNLHSKVEQLFSPERFYGNQALAREYDDFCSDVSMRVGLGIGFVAALAKAIDPTKEALARAKEAYAEQGLDAFSRLISEFRKRFDSEFKSR